MPPEVRGAPSAPPDPEKGYAGGAWAARNFTTFAAQRISVAVHYSVAFEVAHALGLSVAADPRVAG